jgi:hypothetical protein
VRRGYKHPFDRAVDGERSFVMECPTNRSSSLGGLRPPLFVTPLLETRTMVAISLLQPEHDGSGLREALRALGRIES